MNPLFIVTYALLFILTANAESKSKLDWQNAYKIGIVCHLTGPFAKIGTKYLVEIAPYVFKINSHGGINGRALYLFGNPIIKKIPPEWQQHKKRFICFMNKDGQLTAMNDGHAYAEFENSFVFDASNAKNEKRSIDALAKVIDKGVLAVLCQASRKSEMTGILEIAGKTHTPVILFISNPKLVSLPNNNWVFVSTPSIAIETVIQAIKQTGADKERIRNYLGKQLGQQGK